MSHANWIRVALVVCVGSVIGAAFLPERFVYARRSARVAVFLGAVAYLAVMVAIGAY